MTQNPTAVRLPAGVNPPAPFAVPAPPPPRRVDWRRAVRALRELLADPDHTEKAFEVFLALDGNQEERAFQRLLAEPHGRRLAAERPCLLARLSDRAALASLPDGSVGRAYLAYLYRTGLDPGGLVALKAEMERHADAIGEPLPVLDPMREWFRVRSLLMHDLWHVLTGYGTDELGEATLLAFSHAQIPGRVNRLLMTGAALRCTREIGPGFVHYLYRAWRRGRRAVWLVAAPYEAWLDEPLETIRARAGIEPAHVAHPGGIRHGSLKPAPVNAITAQRE